MIRYHRLFCKLFSTKISAGDLYAEHTDLKELGMMACPACGSRGNCAPHASYTRSLIEYEGGEVVYHRVKIRRVRCGSCGHTHAILPEHIVPYSTYSLLFILRVLAGHFLKLGTVEQLCRRYAITPSMLYHWKALFLKHKAVWLGVLKDAETASDGFICQLLALPSYSSDFGKPFWLKAARSFLQCHRDAAYFRHAVF